MNDILIYIAKVTAGTAAFYFIYYVFLKNETYFKLNRIYLLSSLIISIFLPLIHFTDQAVVLPASFSETIDSITVFSSNPIIPQSNISIYRILLFIYICIALFFIVIYISKIVVLFSHLLRRPTIVQYDKFKLIITEKEIPPCSFFNKIIIPKRIIDSKDLSNILSHENVHVKQIHSIDTLLIELLSSILWFNPFIWKIRTAIKNTHEYLADEGVVEQGFDTTRYRLLLLENAVGFKLGLANNLNQSITLKRMLMLNKSKSSWIAKLKVLAVIPVLFLLITAFECKVGPNNTITHQTKNKDLTELPSFPGGHEALVSYLMNQINYPAEAKEKGIQGKVLVNFVVKKDGKITDVTVPKAVNPLLDAEAIRVIKSMPNWIPGKDGNNPVDAEMTLPIDFRLK